MKTKTLSEIIRTKELYEGPLVEKLFEVEIKGLTYTFQIPLKTSVENGNVKVSIDVKAAYEKNFLKKNLQTNFNFFLKEDIELFNKPFLAKTTFYNKLLKVKKIKEEKELMKKIFTVIPISKLSKNNFLVKGGIEENNFTIEEDNKSDFKKEVSFDDMKNYDKKVDFLYKKYDFKPLKYQKEIILDAVRNLVLGKLVYAKSIVCEDRSDPVLLKFVSDDFKKYFNEELIKDKEDKKPSSTYIVNIDVGLGKTIISLIATELFSKFLVFTFSNARKELGREIRVFNKEIEKNKKIKEIFQKRKVIVLENLILNESSIDVKVLAKKIILKEFEKITKGKTELFSFYPMGNIRSANVNGPILIYYIEAVHFISNSVDFDIFSYSVESKRKPLNLFIADERGTDNTFFAYGKSSNVLHGTNPITIGLTANESFPNSNHVISSKRLLKTDPQIKKELEEKQLYKATNFYYKYHIPKSKVIEQQKKKMDKMLEEIGKTHDILYKENENALALLKKYLNNEISDSELSKKINTINLISLKKERNKYIETLKGKIETFNKNLNKSFRNNFFTHFLNYNLQYLLEKNTVIIVDQNFTDEDFRNMKTKFKSYDINLVTARTYDKITSSSKGGNIFIGTSNEISKGLNLQMFDAIVFAYVDSLSLESIYQGIGRLDRIGTIKDKEVILLGITTDGSFLNKFIAQKDKNNSSLAINSFELIKNKAFEKMLVKENKNISKEIKDNFNQLKKIESQTEGNGKEQVEKIKTFKENKKIFLEIFNELDKHLKEIKKMSSTLSGGKEINLNEWKIVKESLDL